MTQFQILVDEESTFLRCVNEGYRTWHLRHRKILSLVEQLESPEEDLIFKVDEKVRSLMNMTLHTSRKDTDGKPKEPGVDFALRNKVAGGDSDSADEAETSSQRVVLDAFNVLEELCKTVRGCYGKSTKEGADAEQPGPNDETAKKDVSKYLRQCHDLSGRLSMELFTVFDHKFKAEMNLKDCEDRLLKLWTESKGIAEMWTKRDAVLKGMIAAVNALFRSPDVTRLAGDDVGEPERQPSQVRAAEKSLATAAVHTDCGYPCGEENLCRRCGTERRMLSENESKGLKCVFCGNIGGAMCRCPRQDCDVICCQTFCTQEDPNFPVRALSEILAQGSDATDREDILKKHHPGSKDHPNACRACHFQGGLCWKGLACSFCHICPKPKRKSKHQRDVEKRRQERYKVVAVNQGAECLDELTKIDEARRLTMTVSEEIKKFVKQIFDDRDPSFIVQAKKCVKEFEDKVVSSFSELLRALPAPMDSEIGCGHSALGSVPFESMATDPRFTHASNDEDPDRRMQQASWATPVALHGGQPPAARGDEAASGQDRPGFYPAARGQFGQPPPPPPPPQRSRGVFGAEGVGEEPRGEADMPWHSGRDGGPHDGHDDRRTEGVGSLAGYRGDGSHRADGGYRSDGGYEGGNRAESGFQGEGGIKGEGSRKGEAFYRGEGSQKGDGGCKGHGVGGCRGQGYGRGEAARWEGDHGDGYGGKGPQMWPRYGGHEHPKGGGGKMFVPVGGPLPPARDGGFQAYDYWRWPESMAGIHQEEQQQQQQQYGRPESLVDSSAGTEYQNYGPAAPQSWPWHESGQPGVQ